MLFINSDHFQTSNIACFSETNIAPAGYSSLDMITISVPIGIAGIVKPDQAEPPPRRGAVREWLPVPAPSLPQARTVRAKSAPVARSIWFQPPTKSKSEKLMFFLLAFAAVIGLGYGFSCLLELVQNWAGFHAGLAQLVH